MFWLHLVRLAQAIRVKMTWITAQTIFLSKNISWFAIIIILEGNEKNYMPITWGVEASNWLIYKNWERFQQNSLKYAKIYFTKCTHSTNKVIIGCFHSKKRTFIVSKLHLSWYLHKTFHKEKCTPWLTQLHQMYLLIVSINVIKDLLRAIGSTRVWTARSFIILKSLRISSVSPIKEKLQKSFLY